MLKALEVSLGMGQGPLVIPRERPGPVHAADDEALVAAAREGDRAALGRLYERYAPMVHAILLGRVPPHEVDDLVHDVFLLAMRGLHGLRDVRRFGPWLAAMARNRAVDQRRQHRVMDPIDHDVAASGGGGGAAAGILAAIGKLPEVYRETLIMRLVEGMTGPEIARKTGLRPGSVRVKLHRGMKMLREALGGPGAQMRSS